MVLWGRHSDKTGERRWHTAIALVLAAFGLSYMSLSSSLATTVFAVACALVGAYAFKGPFWALSSGWLSASTLAAGLAGINAIANLIGLANRMRLFAPSDVIEEAEQVIRGIVERSLKPSVDLRKLYQLAV